MTPGLHRAEWQDFQIPSVQGLDYYAWLADRLKKLRFGKAAAETKQPQLYRGWPENSLPYLRNIQAATKEPMAAISSASEKLKSNILSISTRLETIKRYRAQINTGLANRYDRALNELMAAMKRAERCSAYKEKLDQALLYYYKHYGWPPKATVQDQDGSSGSTPPWQAVTPPSGFVLGLPQGQSPGHGLPQAPGYGQPPFAPGLPNAGPPSGGQMPGQGLPQAPGDIPPPAGQGVPNAAPPPDGQMPGHGFPQPMQKGQSPQPTSDAAAMNPEFQNKMKELTNFTFYSNVVDCAKDLPELAELVSTFISTFPAQVDPPIDSVLHSLQFVIANSASVTPSWTLLQWRGPGQSGSFAGASSVRTHNLQLALGPRTGQAPISQDATRLIQNQTVKSLANSGGGG